MPRPQVSIIPRVPNNRLCSASLSRLCALTAKKGCAEFSLALCRARATCSCLSPLSLMINVGVCAIACTLMNCLSAETFTLTPIKQS